MEVQFDQVRYSYPSGVDAVRGISLTVPAGQRLAIVGQNGAGKTTLVRHLNGIFTPSSGVVRINGEDVAGREIAELSELVGYVFQNPDEQLFARTVMADVSFGPKNLGFSDERSAELVAAALAATGLTHEAETHPHHLSLSERKRVALAAVLAMDTPIVVLDEPTTGQDEFGVTMIARIIEGLRAAGRTVIAITHDMDFCAENFDRVVVMAQGEVHADGLPGEVFTQDAVLAHAAVEPPQLVRLADALAWDAVPMTVNDFVRELGVQSAAAS